MPYNDDRKSIKWPIKLKNAFLAKTDASSDDR